MLIARWYYSIPLWSHQRSLIARECPTLVQYLDHFATDLMTSEYLESRPIDPERSYVSNFVNPNSELVFCHLEGHGRLEPGSARRP